MLQLLIEQEEEWGRGRHSASESARQATNGMINTSQLGADKGGLRYASLYKFNNDDGFGAC